jgi:putative intracellular protease/amidase
MTGKGVYLFVFEGYADWEPAHAVAELRRHGRYRVETVGLTRGAVHSMGGIRVLPSMAVTEVSPSDVAMFILPGGDRWEIAPIEDELQALLRQLHAQHVPIAAICGATIAVAKLGLLRERRHTSNGLAYLRSYVPGYADGATYVDAPAVRDEGLITATGVGDIEFAREIMEELDVLSAADRELWASIFRSARLPESPI